MDIGVELRSKNLPIVGSIESEGGLQTASPLIDPPLDTKEWLSLDNYYGYYFFTYFDLVAESPTAEIWVQQDLSWPVGDPRATPTIMQEMVDYLLDEFSNNIIPTDSAYFGTPDSHDGTYSLLEAWGYFPPGYFYSADSKNVILVSNIRDESYYDSTYPSYIAGFYSPSFEAYFDRNIISIDAYDWEHRVGDEGTEWTPGDPVTRPNLYESVIAHEYQHLIHDDYMDVPESWMNEACSLFAEPLCGYDLDLGQVEWFLETPDNSLIVWGDQGGINILADYGASFLWALYLTDHYGIDILGDYVAGNVAGIEGINLLLPPNVDFEDVFHDWRIANLIDADRGKYGYQLDELRDLYNPDIELDLAAVYPLHINEVPGEHIDWTSAAEEFGTTITHYSSSLPGTYDTGISFVGPYGTDYITFTELKGLNFIKFDGDQDAIYGWTETELYGWYSGAANLLNSLLITDPYTVLEGDILTINTYWDIEDYWDYGFVQVSTDGGNTWTSLENTDTTWDYDPGAHPDIIANLPGLTGWSGDFMDISFDLSAYVGSEVIFGFRYMTDWFVMYEGWYITAVSVDGTSLYDTLTPIYPKAEFMVTVVETVSFWGHERHFVYDMHIRASNNKGFTLTYSRPNTIKVTLIVSPVQLNGFTDYQFKTHQISIPRRCKWG
jgi:hypothetical protein